jgi:hypothetical protein
MSVPYRAILLQHLQAELDRLNDPVLEERAQSILIGFAYAEMDGIEPDPWLTHAAQKLQEELAATMARRKRLVSELDRWCLPTGKN